MAQGTIYRMENDSEKDLQEIRQRIEYLGNTDQLSVSEKIAITKMALEIIENSETKKEVQ